MTTSRVQDAPTSNPTAIVRIYAETVLFLSNPRDSLLLSLPPLCLSWQQAAEDLIHHNSLSPPVSMLGQPSHLPSRSQRMLCSQTWCSPQCHLQSSPGHGGRCCPVYPAPGAWLSGGDCLEDIPPPQAGWYKQPRRGEVHLKRFGQYLEGKQRGEKKLKKNKKQF